jgi:glycerol uptake facilitator-like aquaporin
VAGLLHTHDPDLVNVRDEKTTKDVEKNDPGSMVGLTAKTEQDEKEAQKALREQAYQAALDADAHAKLSIFATRPAKYNRFMNFLQEMLATAILVFGAEMFNLRREFDESVSADGGFTKAMFIAFFIMTLILGLGGTTGLAVNPARDFGPRLAHALLPIPGKGSSEWHYGWVPFVAPFVGAALGAGLFWCMDELYQSGADEEL